MLSLTLWFVFKLSLFIEVSFRESCTSSLFPSSSELSLRLHDKFVIVSRSCKNSYKNCKLSSYLYFLIFFGAACPDVVLFRFIAPLYWSLKLFHRFLHAIAIKQLIQFKINKKCRFWVQNNLYLGWSKIKNSKYLKKKNRNSLCYVVGSSLSRSLWYIWRC